MNHLYNTYNKILILICVLLVTDNVQAQNVGIGTNNPHPSAKLHIEDNNRGVLIPRISLTNVTVAAPVTAPATGLLIFNTNAAVTGGGGIGFYYWNSTQWVLLGGGANTLDMAYDQGGPGVGRVITADAGTVEINGTGGLWVNANNPAQNSGIQVNNTNGPSSSEVEVGFISTAGVNNSLQGVRSISQYSGPATGNFDGVYGLYGTTRHPSAGTINLNTTANSNNKAVGIGGGLSSTTSYTGSAGDVIASVYGTTGHHNSGGGSVTGSRLYAGLFAGNGRTLGLWGENSTYMELIPRRQTNDYDAAVIGFYNASANGGNNNADIGTGDGYLSIEANVTDATQKHVTLQTRTNGNVGIGTSVPSHKLHVDGETRVSSLAGVGNRIVKADANGVLSTVTTTGGAGEVLTSDGAGAYYWQSPVGQSWHILGNAGTSPATNFLGTTDAQDLVFRTNNVENMRINTSGNIDIGAGFDDARIYARILNTDAVTNYGAYIYNDGSATGTTYGTRNLNYSSTNTTKYGLYNYVNSEGTGSHYGIMNYTYMNSASNGIGYGAYNYLSAYGTGNHRANYNYLNLAGTGVSTQNYASYNLMNVATSTNTSTIYGEYTDVDFSSGTSYGEYKEMNSNSANLSSMYGDYNHMLGTGNGVSYAVYNDFDNSGTGAKYGMRNEFADIAGTKNGTYNYLPNGTNSGTFYGLHNTIYNDGTSAKYGVRNYFATDDGTLYGLYNFFTHPITHNDVMYGNYTFISGNGTGAHYGLYMNVPGGTNDYAATFYAGNVVANEIGGNYDFRVEGDTETNLFNVDASVDRVGVGTALPTYRMDIYDPNTAMQTNVYRGRNGTATGTRTQIGSIEYFIDQSSTIDFTGGSNFSINLNAAAAYDLQLSVNSAAKPGSNVWTVASDARLKDDINPFKDGLETLRGINPVYFKYNGKANIQDENYFVGVVAQELEQVAPYMVGSYESAPGDIQFEKQESATETFKSVDNGAMTYITVNAIKELDAKQTKVKETFKNISDFGVASLNGTETFIPFNDDFKNMLTGTPVVAVTALNSTASLTIVSQTSQGFTVKLNGEFVATDFNWVAMAKVKDDALDIDNNYSEAERKAMLSKVKAEKAAINYQREYEEIEIRKIEAAAEAAVRKNQDIDNAPPAHAEENIKPEPVKVVPPDAEPIPEPEHETASTKSKK